MSDNIEMDVSDLKAIQAELLMLVAELISHTLSGKMHDMMAKGIGADNGKE